MPEEPRDGRPGGGQPGDGQPAPDDLDRELEELLAERRAANPRRTPERDPVGSAATRRLLTMTVAAILLSTVVLVAVLLVS
jgi:hypothetical protein